MTEYTPDPRFACRCGCGRNWVDVRLESMVHRLEEEVGERLVVTSGYRCEAHNRAVGGSPTSSHKKGLAADLACDASRLRYRIIGAAIRLGFHRMGIGKNFIHLDIDRSKAPRVIWIYA